MNLGFATPMLVILVVAVCTFLTRFLPFALFGGGKAVPEIVKTLGELLPPAVIAILVVYCLRGIHFRIPFNGLPEFIAIGIVAFLHLWKRNNLVSIGGGTIAYMFLIQSIFV